MNSPQIARHKIVTMQNLLTSASDEELAAVKALDCRACGTTRAPPPWQ